jgi:23S rRNA-/tRNA-specific pseudouridylate synthase
VDHTPHVQVPETVLQYERQLRKQKAAKRASAPLSPSQLDIIYNDEHIIVVNKPPGVLSVPGINSNPSMLTLLYDHLKDELDEKMLKEHMIIHRLDMDTSGIVIYAKSKECMSLLQNAFRERQVDKVYEALLCGHLDPSMSKVKIDLPLQRDHAFPPFMRIATHKSEEDAKQVVKDLNTNGFKKLIKKNAKPSVTILEVIEREYIPINEIGDKNKIDGEVSKIPVTRVKLEPVTGRTHQLRVHCAALGHPIVGDPAYSLLGEANTNGGLMKDAIDKVIPNTPSIELQMTIENWVKVNHKCMCLHAKSLRLEHPVTKKEMLFAKKPDF